MTDSEPEMPPLTRREAVNAPAIIAKAIGQTLAVLTLAGLLVEGGVWKGRLEEKVEQLSTKVCAYDGRMTAVELEAQASKQDREGERRDLEQFRADVNKRLDHQMDRLNGIADRVGVPASSRP